jgi:hypothetical protein
MSSSRDSALLSETVIDELKPSAKRLEQKIETATAAHLLFLRQFLNSYELEKLHELLAELGLPIKAEAAVTCLSNLNAEYSKIVVQDLEIKLALKKASNTGSTSSELMKELDGKVTALLNVVNRLESQNSYLIAKVTSLEQQAAVSPYNPRFVFTPKIPQVEGEQPGLNKIPGGLSL